jgi:hypothetical protein
MLDSVMLMQAWSRHSSYAFVVSRLLSNQKIPRGFLESGLVFKCKIATSARNDFVCNAGCFKTERATAGHEVDKGDASRMACVILSGARSAKSKDLYCFENHRGGDGFFERGVVHESFKTAFIELFAGEV